MGWGERWKFWVSGAGRLHLSLGGLEYPVKDRVEVGSAQTASQNEFSFH